MKHHETFAEMLSFAKNEGFTVCDIPEGMDPVGALVIVLTRLGGGEADEVAVGTITADDIHGTGPFVIFKPDGQLLGAGFTTDDAVGAIQEIWLEEQQDAEQPPLPVAASPFARRP